MRDEASIASWKMRLDPDEDPQILVEYPSTHEVYAMTQWLEENIRSRHGYSIETTGSCNKGPQGVNWTFRVEFEIQPDWELFRDAMLASFGPPES